MSIISHIHGKEEIETDKLQALREYFFLIETGDASINRVECHEKIETLWNTGKDNRCLEYILSNLDIVINLPIDRQLSYSEKIKFEYTLKRLLDSVKDWKQKDKETAKKGFLKRGKTSGKIDL